MYMWNPQSLLSFTIKSDEWDGIDCCHVRALNDIYSEFNIGPSGSDDVHSYCQPADVVGITNTIMSEKITTGLNAVVQDVLPQQSKNDKVEKFAVRASTHNIVHLFKGNKNGHIYIRCCSGLCASTYRRKVNLRTLDEKTALTRNCLKVTCQPTGTSTSYRERCVQLNQLGMKLLTRLQMMTMMIQMMRIYDYDGDDDL
uniref:Uncharacterized protein n=1 Tax=Clytia hemisphaerica TaxID=252671 RepID=A0A7M5WWN7_9CNID